MLKKTIKLFLINKVNFSNKVEYIKQQVIETGSIKYHYRFKRI